MPERDDQLVCIVDDDCRSAAHSATCSCPPGFGVETFESGGACLEAGDRGWIGCLFLEVRLAGMSGVDVLRQLATASVAIPTIVRTVHVDDETPSHRTGREGSRAPQSTAAPPAMPGMGTEKRG
jgi:FixJ family two-component response regulator